MQQYFNQDLFPVEDTWDWPLGQCNCPVFKLNRVNSISFTCFTDEDIWRDSFGRVWTTDTCAHEYFILWIQLYSLTIEKLSR